MIDRRLFESWAERTLRFANLHAGFGDAEAEAVLTGRASEDVASLRRALPDHARPELLLAPPGEFGPWHAPERGYAELHRDWRTFLRALCAARTPWCRRWCVDRSMTQFGEANLLTGDRDGLPFGFDDAGRPQLGHLHACRPEGILALVGAELLSPDATLAVRMCKRQCGQYILNPTVDRDRTRPYEKCPACRLHDSTSTVRVRAWRAAQKRGKKR